LSAALGPLRSPARPPKIRRLRHVGKLRPAAVRHLEAHRGEIHELLRRAEVRGACAVRVSLAGDRAEALAKRSKLVWEHFHSRCQPDHEWRGAAVE
jgi:hypothetical protein